MLRLFRGGGVNQVVIGSVAFAIILMFVLEFRTGRGASVARLQQECAIEFRRSCLDAKDYSAALGLIVPRGFTPRDTRALGLRKRVLDGLVERELLVAEAERLGISVSAEAAEENLVLGRAHVSLPAEGMSDLAFRLGLCRRTELGYGCEPGSPLGVRQIRVKSGADQVFDYKLYEREIRILSNRGPREFKEMQQRELIATRMRELVRSWVQIPESDAYFLFERQGTRATVRSVELRRGWFARFAVNHTVAAVEQWAQQNSAQIDPIWQSRQSQYSADCPQVSEILVEITPDMDADAKKAAQERAAQARARLVKGELFDRIAREQSGGATATWGGHLGCLGPHYGTGVAELTQAIANLKPGELSGVIESPRGFHLIRYSGKLPAADLERVGRSHVAQELYTQFAADEAMNHFATALIQRATAGEKLETVVTALTSAAATPAGSNNKPDPLALNSPDRPAFAVSAPFSVSGNPLPEVETKEPLSAKAFQLEKADDVLQSPVATQTGAVILQLKEKTVPSREDFLKDKTNILQSLKDAKANESLVRYVADLRRRAGSALKIDARFGDEPKGQSTNDE